MAVPQARFPPPFPRLTLYPAFMWTILYNSIRCEFRILFLTTFNDTQIE